MTTWVSKIQYTQYNTFNNENYLLTVDYMSRFSVIRHLNNMAAKMVAEHMKAIFSELGGTKDTGI